MTSNHLHLIHHSVVPLLPLEKANSSVIPSIMGNLIYSFVFRRGDVFLPFLWVYECLTLIDKTSDAIIPKPPPMGQLCCDTVVNDTTVWCQSRGETEPAGETGGTACRDGEGVYR